MNRRLQCAILAADLLWIIAVSGFTHWVRSGPAGNQPGSFEPVLVLAALSIWSVLYVSKQLEGFRGGWHFPRVCAQVTVAVFYLMGSLLVLTFLLGQPDGLRELLGLGCLLPAGLIAIRCLGRWLINSQSNAETKRRVIILGSGRIARELAVKIARHPETAMEVVGLLSPSDAEPARSCSSLQFGAMTIRTFNVLTLMQEERVQELIVVEPLPPGIESAKLIATCQNRGVRVHLVPERYELYISKARLNEIDGIPLVSLEQQSLPALGMELKRRLDIVGAAFFLILSAPLLVFFAAGLFMSKGRVFLKERRCGKNGGLFWMYRFNVNRDAANLAAYERFLVHFSLTEVPQLWNVLRGEMSLVGPRPESPDRVKHYSAWQRERLSLTPGLTGLAQVHGLRERHSSEEKARFDLQYILHWSLFLDLSLLVQTVWIMFVRVAEHDAFRVASESQRRPVPNS
jgi:lipopolysaccharide/colanic/teichoic acid biosynthesis glycosyltransferase